MENTCGHVNIRQNNFFFLIVNKYILRENENDKIKEKKYCKNLFSFAMINKK